MEKIYSSNSKPNIPKPCKEDWDEMTPQDKGRHCQVCDKVVVDFTNKTNSEIQAELNLQFSMGNKVCGHFNEKQVVAPIEILIKKPISPARSKWVTFWSFIGISAMTTTTACAQENNRKTQGEPVQTTTIQKDTTEKNTPLLGKIAIDQPDTTKTCDPILIDGEIEPMVNGGVGEPMQLKGDVAVDPSNTVESSVEKEAYYEGGHPAIARYISDKINLSKKEYSSIPEGTIDVQLIINRDGVVQHVRIKTEISDALNNKISEALYSMNRWSAAIKNGKAVSSYVELPLQLIAQ